MTSNSLYGNPRQKQSSASDTPSSSTLAFTTHLSSLISQDTSNTRGRPRPSKASKSDIFTKHNKGTQKRAAADLVDDDTGSMRQVHQRTADIGAVDAATLHRSKRRMEEKARMYDDLKSGAYLAASSDDDDDDIGPSRTRGQQEDYLSRLRRKEREGLVDFDKKWADAERMRTGSSDEDNDEKDDDNASVVSYEDELGRTRRGTRKEAAEAARIKQEEGDTRINAAERWRPARPDNLIHGATVQAQAFNPSALAAQQMSYLAARRDRSPTPPGEMHYNPDAEVRNRGTGFYAFSKDEEVRRKQMEELMSAREETQRERDARQERKAERERVKDERRKKIDELRTKRRAETFLAGLGDLGALTANRVEADA
ncbi:hypothetical protein ASPWEDRAFT_169153 [Aspergillus wentii DTO 134E9]|uniref:Coiled-coil domain-containing protein 174 n=1 Tax=Aspergillus wentii DTO 134E9 TaxID=1073089 RepID=A0A1L9RWI9_ASPWE|nr:uncharacterized protein ASPWEDRAFT_169153 [Aspergillus wentii DTO 134E9]KAI9929012.1 hypothetical protein MW887_001407 [Aspergillus wentii]OJJ39299.1 hypothetical protein ASPWEDRAFT_169153 [Aspergillus wentii DTO 134E9]